MTETRARDDGTPRASGRRLPLLPLAVVLVGWFAVPAAVTIGRGIGELSWVASSQSRAGLVSLVWLIGVGTGTALLAAVAARSLAAWRSPGPAVAVLLVPAGLTMAGVAVAWRLAFAFRPAGRDQVGVVNAVVDAAGVAPVSWLTQEPLVGAVVLGAALVWVLVGPAATFLLVVHRRDPARPLPRWPEVGSSWRRALLLVALVAGLVALRSHDLVRVATGGSFGTATLSSESIERTIVAGQDARGAALATVLLVATTVIALGVASVVTSARDLVEPAARGGRHRARPAAGDRPGALLQGLVAIGLVVWALPAVGVVVTAIRPADAVASSGWWAALTDPDLTLDGLRTVLGDGVDGGMWEATLRTFALTIPVVAVVLALAASAGTAICELDRRARRRLTAVLVGAAAAPRAAVLPPMVDLLDAAGVRGSLPAVWVAQAGLVLPLATLLVIWRAPIAAVAALVWVVAWGDYLVGAALLDGDGPVAVHVAELVAAHGEDPRLAAAGTVAAALVPLVVLVVGGVATLGRRTEPTGTTA